MPTEALPTQTPGRQLTLGLGQEPHGPAPQGFFTQNTGPEVGDLRRGEDGTLTCPGRAEGPACRGSRALLVRKPAPAKPRAAAPSRAARLATPPPRPHTYSARGSAPPASRLHSSSRSLSADEAVSPPLLPLPFRRCRAPRLAMASVDLKKKGDGGVEFGTLRKPRGRRHSFGRPTVSAEGQKTLTCAETTKLQRYGTNWGKSLSSKETVPET